MTDKRAIWRHNSFFGHVRMAEQNMKAIASAETTSDASRLLAEEIQKHLIALRRTLKERRK